MVLDMDGQPLLGRIKAGASRHRPTPQDAVVFETQIVMEASGRVLVNDEDAAGRTLAA
jgi:hypothetical protein